MLLEMGLLFDEYMFILNLRMVFKKSWDRGKKRLEKLCKAKKKQPDETSRL